LPKDQGAIPGLKQVRSMNLFPISSPTKDRGVLLELQLKPEVHIERFALTLRQAEDLAKALLSLVQQGKVNEGGSRSIQ
jgi:hypothetical protein